jgi:hypothetical protein
MEEKNPMEGQEPRLGLPKSSIPFVVMIAAAIMIGGWLYVDIVRSDLQTQINELRRMQPIPSQVMKGETMKEEGVMMERKGPLSYPEHEDVYSVRETPYMINHTLFNSEGYALNSAECGTGQDASHYYGLFEMFDGKGVYEYLFEYRGQAQDDGTLLVNVYPNVPGYADMGEFEGDFEVCHAGDDSYPHMMNDDWLVFIEGCGSGFDDGSGLPHGCDEIKKLVEGELELE